MVIINGAKLRELRIEQNKLQSEIAAAADTTERYIRDLEKGKKKMPSASIVYGCAHCLGVSMEELMIVVKEEF